jgi:hypothetical protein
MRSGLRSHLSCAAVAFLAACQSPSVNQGIQPDKPGSVAAQPTTPSRYEVGAFDPFQRDRMGRVILVEGREILSRQHLLHEFLLPIFDFEQPA